MGNKAVYWSIDPCVEQTVEEVVESRAVFDLDLLNTDVPFHVNICVAFTWKSGLSVAPV